MPPITNCHILTQVNIMLPSPSHLGVTQATLSFDRLSPAVSRFFGIWGSTKLLSLLLLHCGQYNSSCVVLSILTSWQRYIPVKFIELVSLDEWQTRSCFVLWCHCLPSNCINYVMQRLKQIVYSHSYVLLRMRMKNYGRPSDISLS